MDLIKNAYQLFQDYQISSISNVCTTCCLNVDEVNRLINLEVRKIDVDLLSLYNDSAQAHHPIISEFKHFLPRYLDLINQYEFPSHSVELCLRNLSFYKKDQWLIEEWELIENFAVYFFEKCLNDFPIQSAYTEITDILIMYDLARFDLTPFLQIWESSDSVTASLHFKEMIVNEFDWLRKRRFKNSFGSKDTIELISDWVYQTATQQKFYKKFESIIMNEIELEEKDLNEINWLYDMMENIDS